MLLLDSAKSSLLALTQVYARFEEILSLCITSVSFLLQSRKEFKLTTDTCDFKSRISSKHRHSILTQPQRLALADAPLLYNTTGWQWLFGLTYPLLHFVELRSWI